MQRHARSGRRPDDSWRNTPPELPAPEPSSPSRCRARRCSLARCRTSRGRMPTQCCSRRGGRSAIHRSGQTRSSVGRRGGSASCSGCGRWSSVRSASSNGGPHSRRPFDLVERGAVAVEDGEPRQPDNVAEAPDGTIDVRLRVDPGLLRGDAARVSRWLTWRLGLRQTPSSQRFDLHGLEGGREVVLHRRTGASALSSLRAAAHSLDVIAGCEIVVQLRPQLGTADIRHSCDLPRCPRGH